MIIYPLVISTGISICKSSWLSTCSYILLKALLYSGLAVVFVENIPGIAKVNHPGQYFLDPIFPQFDLPFRSFMGFTLSNLQRDFTSDVQLDKKPYES